MGQPELPGTTLPAAIGHRVLQGLVHAAAVGLARTTGRAPLAVACGAADVAAFLGTRRHEMRANLDLIFDAALSDGAKRAIARSAMRNLFASVVELVRASHPRARGEMAHLVRFEPPELLADVARDTRPLVLAVAHSGNVDLTGLAFSVQTGRSLTVVMKKLGSRAATRLLVEGRRALGFEVLGTWDRSVLLGVLRRLRRGGVVGILPDQYARKLGVVVPFMGHPASTHTGPAIAALRAPDARLLVMVDQRIGDGERHVCLLEEIADLPRSGDGKADVAVLTRRINDVMGRLIEKAPGSYLWQHRRWRVPGRSRRAPRATPNARAAT